MTKQQFHKATHFLQTGDLLKITKKPPVPSFATRSSTRTVCFVEVSGSYLVCTTEHGLLAEYKFNTIEEIVLIKN